MKDDDARKRSGERKPALGSTETARRRGMTERLNEEDPSVEWGERLSSSKAIARGGKNTGQVNGATPNPDH